MGIGNIKLGVSTTSEIPRVTPSQLGSCIRIDLPITLTVQATRLDDFAGAKILQVYPMIGLRESLAQTNILNYISYSKYIT